MQKNASHGKRGWVPLTNVSARRLRGLRKKEWTDSLEGTGREVLERLAREVGVPLEWSPKANADEPHRIEPGWIEQAAFPECPILNPFLEHSFSCLSTGGPFWQGVYTASFCLEHMSKFLPSSVPIHY